ncbi:MAG: hypothetical protein Q8P57_04985 [Candidatus Pacearchaeota archaeon]|nr:hypothetical protein [Candidatus Pacearchaeota archaeon]
MTKLRNVAYSKGQVKIQQMAFVLVATIIFFVIVAIFYTSIKFSSIKEEASDFRKQEVIESVRKISGSPEFLWGNFGDCAGCVDLDKAFLLKNRNSYQNFWKDVSLLQIIRVYPLYSTEECTPQSYPRCNQITLTKKENYESYEAFVSLCRYNSGIEQDECELGKIVMGFESVE